MDHQFIMGGRFSKEEEADDEQEADASNSRREIPFMTASSSAAASVSSASASASASSSAPFRSASGDGAGASGSGAGGEGAAGESVEKEHMFDKVVTPSDVGKLNRLVIPKQYAEKYFPLDAAAGNEKGLLLSFEDSAGKQWRFRYSYWNSSQSYVMTKGWSRFVKEKRLLAGDTVSFSRGAAEDARHRLFIDWKRRTDTRDPFRFPRLALPMPSHYGPHHYSPWNFGGGGAGFFMPPSPPATLYEHRLRQGLDFRGMNYHHPAAAVGRQLLFFGSARTMPPHAPPTILPRAPSPLHYTMMQVQPTSSAASPVVLDSVPVIESPSTAAKRVRLFGVNLDNQEPGGGEPSNVPGNALSLQTPGWQRRTPTLRLHELPHRQGAESSAASSPSSSSSSKREARSALDLDL